MHTERIVKQSFTVIGKVGSTREGVGFIQRLWADANAHFPEVACLAKREANGAFSGFWGAMTDFSHTFLPWEDNFSKGLYLAGVECEADAKAPEGWTKWVIPGFEYLRVKCDHDTVFPDMIAWLEENNISLAGAVQDFTDPATGNNYMYFPIRKLTE
jgi:hypothetical protein